MTVPLSEAPLAARLAAAVRVTDTNHGLLWLRFRPSSGAASLMRSVRWDPETGEIEHPKGREEVGDEAGLRAELLERIGRWAMRDVLAVMEDAR